MADEFWTIEDFGFTAVNEDELDVAKAPYSVDIVYNNNTFYMRSIGDLGEYKLKIPNENLEIVNYEENVRLYNKVSLKFLSYITKIYSVFKTINIKIASEEAR